MIQNINKNQFFNLSGTSKSLNTINSSKQNNFDSFLKAASSQTTTPAKASQAEEVDNYVISPEDKENYCGIVSDGTTTIYYPPDNASGAVKKAWIETMKSFTTPEELLKAKFPVFSAMMSSSHPSPSMAEGQAYLSQFTSPSSLLNLYQKSIENAKDTLLREGSTLNEGSRETMKERIKFEQSVLDLLIKNSQ